jgi:ABC-2 type transport system permease protein
MLITKSDYDNFMSSTPQYILLATLMIAILIVPHLMIEERQTKTIEALLVSPVSGGQVVLGKALAGFFYVALSGILSFTINWAYITNWGLAILAFLCTALFAIGAALLMGSFLKSWGQINLWSFVIMTLLILPALFGTDPAVSAGLKYIFSWWPTTALANLLQFSLSSGVPGAALLRELSIALGFTLLIYALIVWQLRRTEAASSTG